MNSSCTKKISFSHDRNLVAQNFVHFENKKCNYKISCSYVNCRAFHAASCGIFCFLIQRIK